MPKFWGDISLSSLEKLIKNGGNWACQLDIVKRTKRLSLHLYIRWNHSWLNWSIQWLVITCQGLACIKVLKYVEILTIFMITKLRVYLALWGNLAIYLLCQLSIFCQQKLRSYFVVLISDSIIHCLYNCICIFEYTALSAVQWIYHHTQVPTNTGSCHSNWPTHCAAPKHNILRKKV